MMRDEEAAAVSAILSLQRPGVPMSSPNSEPPFPSYAHPLPVQPLTHFVSNGISPSNQPSPTPLFHSPNMHYTATSRLTSQPLIRTHLACTTCRINHKRCDGQSPCLRCSRSNKECIYPSSTTIANPPQGTSNPSLSSPSNSAPISLLVDATIKDQPQQPQPQPYMDQPHSPTTSAVPSPKPTTPSTSAITDPNSTTSKKRQHSDTWTPLKAVSCKYCYLKKTKCDRAKPACMACSKRGIECEYNEAGWADLRKRIKSEKEAGGSGSTAASSNMVMSRNLSGVVHGGDGGGSDGTLMGSPPRQRMDQWKSVRSRMEFLWKGLGLSISDVVGLVDQESGYAASMSAINMNPNPNPTIRLKSATPMLAASSEPVAAYSSSSYLHIKNSPSSRYLEPEPEPELVSVRSDSSLSSAAKPLIPGKQEQNNEEEERRRRRNDYNSVMLLDCTEDDCGGCHEQASFASPIMSVS